MNHRSSTVKVGLLTMVSLAVLITTVIWLRGRSFGGGQSFDVYFKDVDGLRGGAPVQFMGIRVGFVDEVTPMRVKNKQYRVHIKFTITDRTVQVPRGSTISLEQSGIIGEKFVEITPPHPRSYSLELPRKDSMIAKGLPILVAFREGLVPVGEVKNASYTTEPQITKTSPDYIYQLQYIINLPGYTPPDEPELKVTKEKGTEVLVLQDPTAQWGYAPSSDTYFSLEEPLRLKDFLAQQLISAESLETTNDKINKLLSDDAIASIQGTFKNSEELTAQATKVLKQADTLFVATQQDLHSLVGSTQTLTRSVVSVSDNINEIAGDPELKGEIKRTVRSVDTSMEALTALLDDPQLKATLSNAKVTSDNAAELMKYLKDTAVNGDLKGRLDQSITLLDASLTRLSNVLEQVQSVTSDKQSMKGIIDETKETSQNLNKFSKKLNKRFLLFRLLF